jgi:hypothetical protein
MAMTLGNIPLNFGEAVSCKKETYSMEASSGFTRV